MQLINLEGKVFGRLEVIERSPNRGRRPLWRCRCECGSESVVSGSDLSTGHTRSCGCLLKEMRGNANRTHGASRTKEYFVWGGLIQRCEDQNTPAYSGYGARGITVCKRWRRSFEAFLEDMGHRPAGTSIDRIDNDRGYSKRNCRWATRTEQARNKRNNRWIALDGETRTLAEWCVLKGLNPPTVVNRLNKLGWSERDALTTPVQGRKG